MNWTHVVAYVLGLSTPVVVSLGVSTLRALRDPSWAVHCWCGHTRRGPFGWWVELTGYVHRRSERHRTWAASPEGRAQLERLRLREEARRERKRQIKAAR